MRPTSSTGVEKKGIQQRGFRKINNAGIGTRLNLIKNKTLEIVGTKRGVG